MMRFSEGTRVLPVYKAVRVALRILTAHRNKCKPEDHDDEDDFPTGEPELALSIVIDGKDIEQATRAVRAYSQACRFRLTYKYATKQIAQTAATGMASVQYLRRILTKVISKGMKLAWKRKKFHPAVKPRAGSTHFAA